MTYIFFVHSGLLTKDWILWNCKLRAEWWDIFLQGGNCMHNRLFVESYCKLTVTVTSDYKGETDMHQKDFLNIHKTAMGPKSQGALTTLRAPWQLGAPSNCPYFPFTSCAPADCGSREVWSSMDQKVSGLTLAQYSLHVQVSLSKILSLM